MREQFPPITINFTPVKVVGIPGLSLVAIVVAIAVQFPEDGNALDLALLFRHSGRI